VARLSHQVLLLDLSDEERQVRDLEAQTRSEDAVMLDVGGTCL